MEIILTLLLAIGLVWLWFDGLRAREIATAIAREYCQHIGLQFLDGTVALHGWRLRRRDDNMRILRVYHFEYTETGAFRHRGCVTMFGRNFIELHTDSPEPQ